MTTATLSAPVSTATQPNTALSGLLAGQTGLIVGVAHKTSIAWAIAQALSRAGMRLVFTYQGERLEKNVRELAGSLNEAGDAPQNANPVLLPCDVTDDAQIAELFANLNQHLGETGLNTLVHSVAFAKKEDLDGAFLDTSREGYLLAQNISSYSLTALAREATPLMEKAAQRGVSPSIMTLTYLGGERVVQNYNVMGVAKAALEMSVRYLASDLGPKNIRVNAISAGPLKTLAAKGISGFSTITDYMKDHNPMRRNIEASEVGDTGLFLASHLSRGITGEVIHVDAGFHIVGF